MSATARYQLGELNFEARRSQRSTDSRKTTTGSAQVGAIQQATGTEAVAPAGDGVLDAPPPAGP